MISSETLIKEALEKVREGLRLMDSALDAANYTDFDGMKIATENLSLLENSLTYLIEVEKETQLVPNVLSSYYVSWITKNSRVLSENKALDRKNKPILSAGIYKTISGLLVSIYDKPALQRKGNSSFNGKWIGILESKEYGEIENDVWVGKPLLYRNDGLLLDKDGCYDLPRGDCPLDIIERVADE